jgi:hypothetical protein
LEGYNPSSAAGGRHDQSVGIVRDRPVDPDIGASSMVDRSKDCIVPGVAPMLLGTITNDLTSYLPLVSTTLIALAGIYATLHRALNLDVGFFLLAARALADGRILYESFPDYSMPATTWIAVLSLHIANVSGLMLADVHQALLCALTVAGAALTGVVVHRLAGPASLTSRVMPAVIMGLFLFLPGYDSGQRDVLFVVLAAPVVAIVAARHFNIVPGWLLSTASVALATIGSSLKPHYFLPLLVLGVCDFVLRRGRARQVAPELWALAGVLIAYCILVQVMYPTYYFQVLPNAAKFYAFQRAWIVSLFLVLRVAAGAGVAAVILLLAIARDRARSGQTMPLGLVAGWAALGASLLVVYYVQHMGFRYHRVPLLLFTLVSMALFAVMGIEIGLRRWVEHSKRPALAWILGTSMLSLAITAWVVTSPTRNFDLNGTARADAVGDPVTQVFRSLPAKSYVLALETGVPPVSPMHAYADVQWSGEFGSNDEIASIMADRLQAHAEGRQRDPYFVSLEQHVREAVARSLMLRRPRVVILDVSVPPRWFEHYDQTFSLLPWFRQDPAFAAAWADYEYVETVKSFENTTVQIWRLRASASGAS